MVVLIIIGQLKASSSLSQQDNGGRYPSVTKVIRYDKLSLTMFDGSMRRTVASENGRKYEYRIEKDCFVDQSQWWEMEECQRHDATGSHVQLLRIRACYVESIRYS